MVTEEIYAVSLVHLHFYHKHNFDKKSNKSFIELMRSTNIMNKILNYK